MEVNRTVFREDHEMLRATARRFFERECVPRQAEWDRAGEVDRKTWLKAGREGLLCVTLPTEYGGGGGDFGHAAVVVEELHRAGVSGAGFSRHSDIIAPYIERLGSEEQKRRWLPGVCSGETILSIAMTEPGCRFGPEGDAHDRGARWRPLRHQRQQDLHQQRADLRPGAAGLQDRPERRRQGRQPDPGRGRPRRASGAAARFEKVGQPAADTGELFFDDVRVPVTNRLGEENQGFAYLMQELPQERLLIAIYAAVALERALDLTLDYVKQRKAFGQTVWDFQNTRFKLADAKAQAVATRTLVDYYIGEHLRRKLTRAGSGHRQAVRHRDAVEVRRRHGAAAWRLRLHARSTRSHASSPTTASRASPAGPARSCAT